MNFNINGIFNPENRFWSFIDKIVNLVGIVFSAGCDGWSIDDGAVWIYASADGG